MARCTSTQRSRSSWPDPSTAPTPRGRTAQSARAARCCGLLGAGLSNQAIATELFISEHNRPQSRQSHPQQARVPLPHPGCAVGGPRGARSVRSDRLSERSPQRSPSRVSIICRIADPTFDRCEHPWRLCTMVAPGGFRKGARPRPRSKDCPHDEHDRSNDFGPMSRRLRRGPSTSPRSTGRARPRSAPSTVSPSSSPAGVFTAIMGPSGSGKSHADALRRRTRPLTSGQVFIGDVDLSDSEGQGADHAAARPGRLHLPGLQPHPDARRATRTSPSRSRSPAASPTRTGSTA